jgi:hypothetical protein
LTEIIPVLNYRGERLDQVCGSGFRKVSARARRHSFLGSLPGIVLREHQNFRVELSPNSAGRFQTIQLRHANIHQDYVRPKFQRFLHALASIARLTADLPVRKTGQQTPHRVSQWLTVVNDQYSTHDGIALIVV